MSDRPDVPAHRYDGRVADEIETRWQATWDADGTYHAPNPSGPLADGFDAMQGKPKTFVLDMFPYPSGDGLHVGHPLGFIGTDVYARYLRMTGHNVLHTMGFDAFGLPAEQYAVQTGQHPRVTTEANVANYRRQLHRLGLGHDPRRSVSTTDVTYYRWTHWIFLQIFNSWYDRAVDRARPIDELVQEFEIGVREPPDGRDWAKLDPVERREVVDSFRLAYLDEAPVNWCPGLGTVLANEEVTSDGRSDRGNFPVFKRPLKQWKMRITAYADRLIDDLDKLDWPESIKLIQRNWIGRSEGALIHFPAPSIGQPISVFTTRPDTMFGATYVVLAPEHPLVDLLLPAAWPEGTPPKWTGGAATPFDAVAEYLQTTGSLSDLERQVESRQKTGVFTGAYATNPATNTSIPVFVADYVLMGYGTGAIMAVPGQDERDWEFAEVFDLPIVRTVQPSEGWDGKAYVGDGPAINSDFLDGLGVADAKRKIIDWLEAHALGEGTITYRLRDWLFSRQRYWGEPFPIIYDDTGLPIAVPESMLPVLLPETEDFSPRTFADDDATSMPEPPLARAHDWVEVELDLGDGARTYWRETNTMPQWAGSCWYELRYLDPTNENAFVDAAVERYWMGPQREGDPGGVDLYVGGVEHAVLHLLYARFWHKVLFDLGHASSFEPYRRLYNQGYILAAAYQDARGMYVDATAVQERDGRYYLDGVEVKREMGKMGKSLKNGISPDEYYRVYGADTLRLYEMFTGPLDQERPWETRAIVGVHRFLQRLWRLIIDEDSGEMRINDTPADDETRRVLHRTIDAVRRDMADLRFNTAIAKLTELNNHVTAKGDTTTPREVAEPLVLMVAPLAPHIAEELWHRLGHAETVVYAPFPEADPAMLIEETVEIPVQVKGKVRAHLTVAADADAATIEAAALADPAVVKAIDGNAVQRVVVVPGRMVNVVT
jgi:leucyl-tRNA synthetase